MPIYIGGRTTDLHLSALMTATVVSDRRQAATITHVGNWLSSTQKNMELN